MIFWGRAAGAAPEKRIILSFLIFLFDFYLRFDYIIVLYNIVTAKLHF